MKSKQERAEDVAYTLNHAISCGATDIFVQPLAATLAASMAQQQLLPRWMQWLPKLFEHDEGVATSALKTSTNLSSKARWSEVWGTVREQMKPRNFGRNLMQWGVGETAGDAGGIIPTIMMQRFFPGFMDGMRQKMEPWAGGFFQKGAARDAVKWGRKYGFEPGSPEVRAKETELYDHEMRHLPQAVMWNCFSIPINFATQRMFGKPGEKITLPTFIVAKGFGTLFSNSVLLGGRAAAPEMFIAWDRWNSEHIIKPVLNGPGRLLGIDKKTADRVLSDSHDDRPREWRERVHREDGAEVAAGRA